MLCLGGPGSRYRWTQGEAEAEREAPLLLWALAPHFASSLPTPRAVRTAASAFRVSCWRDIPSEIAKTQDKNFPNSQDTKSVPTQTLNLSTASSTD
jgi:hypothetical protein